MNKSANNNIHELRIRGFMLSNSKKVFVAYLSVCAQIISTQLYWMAEHCDYHEALSRIFFSCLIAVAGFYLVSSFIYPLLRSRFNCNSAVSRLSLFFLPLSFSALFLFQYYGFFVHGLFLHYLACASGISSGLLLLYFLVSGRASHDSGWIKSFLEFNRLCSETLASAWRLVLRALNGKIHIPGTAICVHPVVWLCTAVNAIVLLLFSQQIIKFPLLFPFIFALSFIFPLCLIHALFFIAGRIRIISPTIMSAVFLCYVLFGLYYINQNRPFDISLIASNYDLLYSGDSIKTIFDRIHPGSF
jgi:hypothetical protein